MSLGTDLPVVESIGWLPVGPGTGRCSTISTPGGRNLLTAATLLGVPTDHWYGDTGPCINIADVANNAEKALVKVIALMKIDQARKAEGNTEAIPDVPI